MSSLVTQAKCWYQSGPNSYVKESPTEAPLFMEAVVLQSPTTPNGDVVIQVTLNQEKVTVQQSMITPRSFDPQCISTYPDMVKMPVLNEAEILNNTFVRFRRDEIYSYIGPTLLVMNPYKQPKVSDTNLISKLSKAVFAGPTFEIASFEPHVYAVSGLAFKLLMNSEVVGHTHHLQQKKQAIVISGESGAGKTEQAKYSMRFLTGLSEARGKKSKSRRNGIQLQQLDVKSESPIEERILSCNPILEAFGNAKTVKNDNSSRFGKYVKIQVQGQKIVGATIMNYLLEKSRVVSQQPGERNYHVFYLMLYGTTPGELTSMGLIQSPLDSVLMDEFPYLTPQQEDLSTSFAKSYQELLESLQNLAFQTHEIRSIMSVLAAILHLGAVRFDDSHYDENSTYNNTSHYINRPCAVENVIKLQMVAQLLGISFVALSKSLVLKIRSTPTSKIESPIKKSECLNKRDALAKYLYDRVFNWLVVRLNASLTGIVTTTKSIGLLDIFGFENFTYNSFEQLCINYTNERLQQLYINYVFKREKQEFIEDGLEQYLSELQFSDNQHIVTLLDGQMSIYSLLDEECMLKNGNDEAFLNKAQKFHIKHPHFSASTTKRTFLIRHTASEVVYQATNFVQKNRDEANKELEDAISSSSNQVVASIFQKTNAKQAKTLGAGFRNEMTQLMTELESCEVHFVRCIKPNEMKQRDYFVWTYVYQQIKYLGVLDSINIRKNTYPNRLEYVQFYSQFRELDLIKLGSLEQLVLKKTDFRELVQNLLTNILPSQDPQFILYGQKRVYLKKEFMQVLDDSMLVCFKIKCQAAKLVLRCYRIYRFRKSVSANLKCLLRAIKLLRKKVRREYLKRYRKRMKALLEVMEFVRKILLSKGFQRIHQVAKKKQQQRKKQLKLQTNSQRYLDGLIKLKLWMLRSGYYTIKQAMEYAKFKENVNENEYTNEDDLGQDQSQETYLKETIIYDVFDEDEYIQDHQYKKKLLQDSQPETVVSIANIHKQYQLIDQALIEQETFDYNKQVVTSSKIQSHTQTKQQFFTGRVNFQTTDPNLNYNSSQIDYKSMVMKQFTINQKDQFQLPYQEALVTKMKFFDVTLKAMVNKHSTHSSDAPYSKDRDFQFNSISTNFIQNLKQFDIFTWAEGRVNQQKSFFGLILSSKQILTFQVNPIKQSLLQHASTYLEKRACDIFKQLLNLMKEIFSYKLSQILNSVINECMTADQQFRDEVFLQMIKLINQNKKKPYLIRVLHIFSAIAFCILPSQYLTMAIMNFFMLKCAETKDPEEEQCYRYIFARVVRKMKNSTQTLESIPQSYQLLSVMTQRQIWVPVFICTGGTVVVWADSHETIDQIKTKALDRMGINIKRVPLNFFGMFQIVNNKNDLQERLLPGNKSVWEVLGRWQDQRTLETKLQTNGTNSIFILMLKIIYSFEYTQDDFLTKQLIFSQTFYDLFTGKFQLNDDHMDEVVFILNRTKGLTLNMTQCLPYLPKNSFNQKFTLFKETKFEDVQKSKIIKDSELLQLEDSQFKFLQIAESYPQFLCVYFSVKYSVNKQFINDRPILVGLKPFRILILKLGIAEPFECYTYDQITKWGVNEKNIIFHTSDGKFHLFETPHSQEMAIYIQDCSTLSVKLKDIKIKLQNDQIDYSTTDLKMNSTHQSVFYETKNLVEMHKY